ncbi:DUF1330 domain-containing protein [Nitratireductor pacificus]|uniref:DUF1330 domain-containing protein n=1 Tax=Nitratireductor pacificus pht-3B TaxID=391937 RepID=K2N7C8_9HYPH|nr:DUF1330 domain-containing protein [Nitratireductor pacificus]EKF20028.1 hypothetical protein NA2_04541 [Nitratireductor pacificus pht-3B]
MPDAYTTFSKETFAAFRADGRAGPVHMLNLIRLHPQARYPDGRTVSGQEAYEAYGRLSARAFARAGGRICWRGRFELSMIGPADETWDICFIAGYPSPEAFTEMLCDPGYREAMAHRQAAVADSRLIRFGVLSNGVRFDQVDSILQSGGST